jgi:hypothetical protein
MSDLVLALDTDNRPVEAETRIGYGLGNCLPYAARAAMSREAESSVWTPEKGIVRCKKKKRI